MIHEDYPYNRKVSLDAGWSNRAYTPFILKRKDGSGEVTAYPGIAGYYYTEEGRKRPIRERDFEYEARCLYRSLPNRKLTIKDLVVFRLNSTGVWAYIKLITVSLIVAGVAMLFPMLTKMLTGEVLESGDMRLLGAVAVCMVTWELTSRLMGAIKNAVTADIQEQGSLTVESAVMQRMLNLPISFFRRYTPGEMVERMRSVTAISDMVMGGIVSSIPGVVLTLAYLTQVRYFASPLMIPAVIMIIISAAITVITGLTRKRLSIRESEVSARESGAVISLLSGIEKLRLTGTEKQGYDRWESLYNKKAGYRYDPPAIVKYDPVISQIINLAGTIMLYYIAARMNVQLSDYLAFNAAYGGLMGAVHTLLQTGLTFSEAKGTYDLARPILENVPERHGDRQITDLKGDIDLDHITFSYDDTDNNVLEDVSLHIEAGECIGITGASGSGKTTLIRIILGLEKPQRGNVRYDGVDIDELDIDGLSSYVGAALQDAQAFWDDIYANITIAHPELTEEDAWEAARLACVDDYIRELPLGIRSPLDASASRISGGQKQRFMIARALASKPRVVVLDEATSALSEEMEGRIMDNIRSTGATVIVVAHRPSALRCCDRVLDIKNI